MITILIGVAGAGKTVVGQALAQRTGLPFYDGDDFHPPANIAKMAAGVPLDDADRAPWLESLALQMQEWEQQGGAILACSALKHDYRLRLVSKVGKQAVRFVYLKAEYSTLLSRLQGRTGHFFSPSLLQSQLETLQEPDDALTVSAEDSVEAIVDTILGAGG